MSETKIENTYKNTFENTLFIGEINRNMPGTSVALVYIKIEEEDNKSTLSINGVTAKETGNVRKELQRMFQYRHEDLYISREQFENLMAIWADSDLKDGEISRGDADYLKLMKTPDRHMEIEKKLDLDSNFSVSFEFAKKITFESSFKEKVFDEHGKPSFAIFDINYQVPGERVNRFFHYVDIKKESLSRREVLNAFTYHIKDALVGSDTYREYKWHSGEFINRYDLCYQAKFDLEQSGLDIIDLENTLYQRRNSNYAGIKTEEGEILSQNNEFKEVEERLGCGLS